LRVRLFTAGSNRIFKLIPGDVGRLITDIASELNYPELAENAREVLRSLAVHEQPAAALDGRWFLVRIMPYRTLENMIDGVVMTFTDITASKTLEGKLRTTQAGLEKHITDQDLKLEQSGEALQAEIKREQAGVAVSKTLEGKLRATQAGLEKHIAEQDVKLEQAGEAMPVGIKRKGGSK
jgi:two-component system CheB/CheR fusion protein